METPIMYRNPEAAKFLRVSTSTLNKWRHSGTGPRFTKCGSVILYRKEELEGWLNGRVHYSTSEYPTTPGTGRPGKKDKQQ